MNICAREITAGLLTAAIGLMTLAGWLFDIETLKRIHPAFPLMYPDTALAFVLSGGSLAGTVAGWRGMARALACAVLALGVLPLLADVTESGLYAALWSSGGGLAGAGHMSAMSSSVFILAGAGLAAVGKDRMPPLAQFAALGILAVAAFALIGYAYDVPWIHASANVMAVHTAFAAALLGWGLLFAEPRRGFAAVILSEQAGGLLLRRLLPFVIAVPAVLGWFRLRGEYAGLYGMNTGLALFALSNIAILTILLYRNARLLNRKDAALRNSEAQYRSLVGNIPDTLWTTDAAGKLLFISSNAEKILGISVAELLAGSPEEVWFARIHPEDLRRVQEAWVNLFARHHMFNVEYRYRRKDGAWIWLHERSLHVYECNGTLCADGLFSDASERVRTRLALEAGEKRLRAIFDAEPECVKILGADGTLLDINPAGLAMIEADHLTQALGQECDALVAPHDRAAYRAFIASALQGETAMLQFEITGLKGAQRWLDAIAVALPFEEMKAETVLVIARDMTARKLAETQLRKLSLAVEHSPTAIVITDVAAKIEYANPKFYQLTGYAPEEIIGQTPRILQSGLTARETYQALWETILAGKDWHGEFHDRKKNGQSYWCLQSISPVKNEHGAITHFVSVTEDISERKHSESVIRHLAFYDPLTDLPNRALFRDRLVQTVALAQRNEHAFALMYLDLDRFKNVNDTLGHPVGDRLLKAVAERIRRSLRYTDTVARLGGDEFAVVVQDITCAGDALRLAEHLLYLFTEPFFIEKHELFITPSIGISIYPQDAADSDALIKLADVALYRAKELGRNNCQFFTADMNAAALEHLLVENQLRHALERHELVLYYQPQIDLHAGTICGVEALLRWRHPDRGMVPPGEFITIAEDSGLIAPIGAWVLREACLANKAWLDAGLPEILVAVNVSAKQLRQKDFVDTVAAVLAETELPPHLLEVELTESCVMQDPEQAIAILEALKAMGIKLAMDDFGTGYSGLAYLKRLPFDKIKIDRSFVTDVAADADDAAIARTIIAMAHSMHRIAIAEGVETTAQLDFLRAEGCDEIQGYYFSRPLEQTALERFIRERSWLA
ncbi:MAG: EAL domain-containing protein [Methylococcaceae bacterium]|nr:MAG: EAL domain-containing protein [Methylococcaceae bacterium]